METCADYRKKSHFSKRKDRFWRVFYILPSITWNSREILMILEWIFIIKRFCQYILYFSTPFPLTERRKRIHSLGILLLFINFLFSCQVFIIQFFSNRSYESPFLYGKVQRELLMLPSDSADIPSKSSRDFLQEALGSGLIEIART